MKRLLCAGVLVILIAFSAVGCGGASTPARISTNTPPATLTLAPTSAPTNTPLPKPTNTPAPTNPPATAAATRPSASATTAPATAATKPTSAATATTAAATKSTSAPTAATPTGQPGTNTSSAAVSKDMCLACHGPFDKLAASTATYVAPSGEKGSPHVFVPHDATANANIPECSNCHQSHPLPPPTGAKPTPASVDWCYGSCHHQNDFTPCKKCHD